ncbi:MAG: TatD family hydrolase [Planctomycetes bacterium]|nr:TatD family hydrolase [Planctomycetota bacterium]
MQGLIDSHCHLTSDALWPQADDVIARAKAAGVTDFVTIATDIEDAARAQELAARHSSVHMACGIHPHEAGKVTDGWDRELGALASRPDVCAVGEMGLDYHYDYSDRPSQHRVFRRQLGIACDVNKPVVIHCREAHADVLAILADFPMLTGVVFHCFTGSKAEAIDILGRGYWLSLTGVVTFKRSQELREVAKMLPADQIMIETDSPYLSPEPVRSARPNEPAYLAYTAQCMAEVRGLSLPDLTALTRRNTHRFFGLPNTGEP